MAGQNRWLTRVPSRPHRARARGPSEGGADRAHPGAARRVEEGPIRVSADMAAPRPAGGGGAIADYFKFVERGTDLITEARGGLTTFMVMVYIVFVNASILGDGFGLAPTDPGRIALS